MSNLKTKTIDAKPGFKKLLQEIDQAGTGPAKASPEQAAAIIKDIQAWQPNAVEKNALLDRISRNRDGFAPAAAAQLDAFSANLSKLQTPAKLAATTDLVHLVGAAATGIAHGIESLLGGAVPTHKVTLAWDPPTKNQDGTPLTDLTGYKVYYGNASGNYTQSMTVNDPNAIGYSIQGLGPGTYYFAVTALAPNQESKFSNEAHAVIP